MLGFGFPTPYLGVIETAERVLAFMPAGQGVIDWPSGSASGSAAALVDEDSLPLPDSSIDLVILVHGLEMSDRPNALMAELRRVLASGGRLIVVVPNRQGPWASTDLSPFGFGRPYSRGQLRQLFAEVGFEAETWTTGLHMAPAAVAPAARRGAGLRPHRPPRLAGLRRGDRRGGGEAHGARDHGPREATPQPRAPSGAWPARGRGGRNANLLPRLGEGVAEGDG